MANVAYKRVSSIGQNSERQLDGLSFDKEFEDKCSGRDINRPALQAMLNYVRENDTIHVHDISRLARDTSDLLKLVDSLNSKGVSVTFHKEGLAFKAGATDAQSKLMLTIFGAVAAFNLAIINEARKEGQEAAKRAGKHIGRKSSLTSGQIAEIKANPDSLSKQALAAKFGVSRATIYNVL